MYSILVNLFYPALCRGCGKKSTKWNQNICTSCLKRIKKRLPPFCAKCGKQIAGDPEEQNVCVDCKNDSIYFDRALSVFRYEGLLKDLIHDFKYKKMTSLSEELVAIASGFIEEHNVGKKSDLVLSIPMHRKRFLEREVNTSDILAKSMAKKLNIPYSSGALKKIKNTSPQSRLSRAQRIDNITYSFSIPEKRIDEIRHKNILLVDDLFTTGSTVNECAKMLKESGSGLIEIITLARGDKPA